MTVELEPDCPIGSLWRDPEGSIYVVDAHRAPSYGNKDTVHVTCTHKAPHIVRHTMDMWMKPDSILSGATRIEARKRQRRTTP